jgi:O-6-methylguanine DNA methyltransferase
MLVANDFKNLSARPSPGSSKVHRPGPRVPEHFVALIPTGWGICGAAWKYHEDESPAESPFAARPASAVLCKLTPPGLSVGELRKTLLRDHPLCDEVFGDGHGNFHPEVVPDWFPQLVRYLQSYYANCLRDWTLPELMNNWTFWKARLDWSLLTPFQRQVLEVTAGIPRGKRLTYGEVARKINSPKASRAVGAALGANPWPVLIPCHRVVGSTGKMTGFSAPGGVTAKKRMLAMETDGLLFP